MDTNIRLLERRIATGDADASAALTAARRRTRSARRPTLILSAETLRDIETTVPQYRVETVSAQMPASCWGRYVHVRVIRDDGSSRRTGNRIGTVVEEWLRCHLGRTDRCASAQAETAAYALADALRARDLRLGRQRSRRTIRMAS